ncbi:hypothetical protein [Desulfomarina sp.]
MNKSVMFCIICLCFLLSACSVPLQKYNQSLKITAKPENRLYSIRIEQWGDVRFTGLLALRFNGLSLSWAMLDATGIKLIEGEVDFQGRYTIKRAMTGLKGSSLPGYLSTSLARTFLMIPLDYPCSRDGLMFFCISPSGDGYNKIMKIEPFTLWEVQRSKGEIFYLQPWLGMRMTFRGLPGDGNSGS